MNKKNTVILTLLAVALTACGGGGGGTSSTAPSVNTVTPAPSSAATSTPVPTATPAPTAIPNLLRSSESNLSHYVGSWYARCILVTSNGATHGMELTMQMGNVSNNQEIPVSVTMWDYGAYNTTCNSSIKIPTLSSVKWTLKVNASTAVTGGTFTGNLDQITVTENGTPTTLYLGFDSNYKSLRLSNSTTINPQGAVYTKTSN
ncbi:hypothetical protein HQ393_07405 [Chitinibacter bivalviorum]|uniref:Lipocalin-like domain-containing protein n=1 Tax=Chitinibacter bivalviorum TaxID=2739434 RepID=A0A7H9BHK1_9NEIS|nr:hypothetical protein [Chitinibacter bivalviorum]QLG88095.1 hypothetical protein HQ393_07405 [Chitinibacter bivalviorum]